MGNEGTYITSPDTIRRHMEMTDEIGSKAYDDASRFAFDSAQKTHWTGNDSFGKQLRPKVDKEHEVATQTAQSIADSVKSAVDALHKSLLNIQGTHENNLDGIADAANASFSGEDITGGDTKGGSGSGRH
jgi:hypothetical protein